MPSPRWGPLADVPAGLVESVKDRMVREALNLEDVVRHVFDRDGAPMSRDTLKGFLAAPGKRAGVRLIEELRGFVSRTEAQERTLWSGLDDVAPVQRGRAPEGGAFSGNGGGGLQDRELVILGVCAVALEGLDPIAVLRILDYLRDRYAPGSSPAS